MFELVFKSGPYAGQIFEVPKGSSKLGRGIDCAIQLPRDLTISRSHIEFQMQGGQLLLKDLSSTSGTQLNGRRIPPQSSFKLSVGDNVNLGNSNFTIRDVLTQSDESTNSSVMLAPPVQPIVFPDQCTICHVRFAQFGRRARNSTFRTHCNPCAHEVQIKLDQFRVRLHTGLQSWSGIPNKLAIWIDELCMQIGISRELALTNSAKISVIFLQRCLTFFLEDGHLSDSEEQVFNQYKRILFVKEEDMPETASQLRSARFRRELRQAKLPIVQTTLSLRLDEIVHLEANARHHREMASSIREHDGDLLITNSRIIFANTDFPFEVSLSKVLRISCSSPREINLELGRQRGTGRYFLRNSEYFAELATFILDVHQRRAISSQSDSRVIPQHVKSEVWARDGEKCVQCGDSNYLEFDHIIPFSKGGATSVGNLQLLCRRCNLKKGNRI